MDSERSLQCTDITIVHENRYLHFISVFLFEIVKCSVATTQNNDFTEISIFFFLPIASGIRKENPSIAIHVDFGESSEFP